MALCESAVGHTLSARQAWGLISCFLSNYLYAMSMERRRGQHLGQHPGTCLVFAAASISSATELRDSSSGTTLSTHQLWTRLGIAGLRLTCLSACAGTLKHDQTKTAIEMWNGLPALFGSCREMIRLEEELAALGAIDAIEVSRRTVLPERKTLPPSPRRGSAWPTTCRPTSLFFPKKTTKTTHCWISHGFR